MINEPFLNRNHKDALFRFIFKNPKDLLSLYNALNGTDYTDVSDLTVTTLEDIVYMSYKNDISFILGSQVFIKSMWLKIISTSTHQNGHRFQYHAT
ncbi:MAG: hypothetical protein BHW18_01235 [Eubacterium sp. 36_13]|nr:MAG: hypothetical protein BHW18_01235 [Eubacterium sp. 36_13]